MLISKRRLNGHSDAELKKIKGSREPAGTAGRNPRLDKPMLTLERSNQKIKIHASGVVAYLISVALIFESVGYLLH